MTLPVIGVLTLWPAPSVPPLPLLCLLCGPFGSVDFALNLGMFLPLGIAGALLGGGNRTVFGAGFVLSMAIEALQWFLVPGRHAALGDVVANSLGAAFGGWLVHRASIPFRARGRNSLPLAWSAGILASGVVAVAAWLMAPAVPATPQWILWDAPRPGFDPFPAKLRNAEVNLITVTGGQLLAPQLLVKTPEKSINVDALIEDHSGATKRQAYILAAATREQEAFFLGQLGDALVFRSFMNASRARLRPVMARADKAFGAGSPGGHTILSARSDPMAITLSATSGASRTSTSLSRTVGLAWTLFLPWPVAIDSSSVLLNSLFLALLAIPATFFGARSRLSTHAPGSSALMSWLPSAIVIATLWLASEATGIATLAGREWAGVVAGMLGGALAGSTRGIHER